MELAKILVSGTDTRVVSLKAIPAGITGATVRFVYEDPAWSGLRKHAVFVGTKTVVVMDVETVAEIPQEVVDAPGPLLKVGVFGTDTDRNLAIPTIYANLGRIVPAADPSGDPSTDATLPVWAQLMERIERLELGGVGSDEIVLNEDGYVTTLSGGFEIDEDGCILL